MTSGTLLDSPFRRSIDPVQLGPRLLRRSHVGQNARFGVVHDGSKLGTCDLDLAGQDAPPETQQSSGQARIAIAQRFALDDDKSGG